MPPKTGRRTSAIVGIVALLGIAIGITLFHDSRRAAADFGVTGQQALEKLKELGIPKDAVALYVRRTTQRN